MSALYVYIVILSKQFSNVSIISLYCLAPYVKQFSYVNIIYLYSNTTRPALSGGKLDRCASGIGLHRKWVKKML